jgi:hypothetical protein
MPKLFDDYAPAAMEVQPAENDTKKCNTKAAGTLCCVENNCYGREKMRCYVTLTAAEVANIVKQADVNLGMPYLAAHVIRVLICAAAVRAMVGDTPGVAVTYMEKDKIAVASSNIYGHLYVVKLNHIQVGDIMAYVMGDSAEWMAGATQPGN